MHRSSQKNFSCKRENYKPCNLPVLPYRSSNMRFYIQNYIFFISILTRVKQFFFKEEYLLAVVYINWRALVGPSYALLSTLQTSWCSLPTLMLACSRRKSGSSRELWRGEILPLKRRKQFIILSTGKKGPVLIKNNKLSPASIHKVRKRKLTSYSTFNCDIRVV